MDHDREEQAENKLVALTERFTLSSRWFAFALVVGIIAVIRQISGTRGSTGPQLMLNALGVLLTLLLVAISATVIAVRYWHPMRRPPDRG